MAKLSWISDSDIENAVTHLLEKAKDAKDESDKKFGKNVIDPFSAIFEMSGFKINYDSWISSEK